MLYHLGLLPIRVPSREAVHRSLHAGHAYRIAAGHRTYLNITLTEVTLDRPHAQGVPVTETVVKTLLVLTALGAPGERYEDPRSAHLTPEEKQSDAAHASLAMTPRASRKLARILSVRAAMRSAQGL